MKFSVLNRKVHYWLTIFIALPLLITTLTGIMLHFKKQIAWIQPVEKKGTKGEAKLSLPELLDTCKKVEEISVKSWDDIARVDFRPSKGLIKVTTKGDYEIQVDAVTGEVLQTAYRRSDIIEAFHDGSWFHDQVKFWIFMPTGIALLVLWVTGMYLFWLPIVVKWNRKKKAKAIANS